MAIAPILHKPHKDSPKVFLTESINTLDTILKLSDTSALEALDITRLTLGIGSSVTETVTVVSYEINNEVIVTRGSPSYSWLAETPVARVLTASDITDIHGYLQYIDTDLLPELHAEVGTIWGNFINHDHSYVGSVKIPTGGIVPGAISDTLLATNAVTMDKISSGAVTESKIANNAVTEDKIGTGAVTSAKIYADAISGSKIADGAVDSEHIVNGAIDTVHIGDLQVTNGKIASNAITSGKISTGAVTSGKILVPFCMVQCIDYNISVLTDVYPNFTLIDQDVDTMWASGNPNRITFPTSGWYSISFFVSFNNNNGTSGDFRMVYLDLNGSVDNVYPILGSTLKGEGTTEESMVSASLPIYFTANDYITMRLKVETQPVTVDKIRLSAVYLFP